MSNWSTLSDMELVALLKEGDQRAYTEIYHRYKKLLYVFALKRLDDADECKDILHELFLAIWARRAELHITGSLSSYLYTAVRNRIIDLMAHREVSDQYMQSFQHYLDKGVSNTDHLVRHKELLALIENEVAALPPRMRQVFELSRKTNYSRREIAEQLGLSEETVKSHLHHALRLLRGKLGFTMLSLLILLVLEKK
ncbi:RNA polymerase sigma factor [Chitinophaga lutea]